MPSRREQVLGAAVEVFADAGMHGLTHLAVDRYAHVALGTTSNYYRTRQALVRAVVSEVGQRRLGEEPGGHDRRLALSWFELLIQAQREPWIMVAIEPVRASMTGRLAAAMPQASGNEVEGLMALATGIEFAELVTGSKVRPLVELERPLPGTS